MPVAITGSDATLPLAQQIAQAVALGAVSTPTDAQGWQNLVDGFQSGGSPIPGTSPARLTASPLGTPATPGVPATPSMSGGVGANASAPSNVKQFVNQMSGFAAQAQAATGINASVILAQWGNETGWGSSPAWLNNFNPAGIGITSDAVHGASYGSPAGGVRAYIDFVNGNPRYQMVKNAGVNDPNAQAVAFGNSGWAEGKYDDGHGPGSSLISNLGMFSSTPGAAQPVPQNAAPAANAGGSSAVAWASQQIGTKYVWGGEDPSAPGHAGAFDCSGLVQAAYAAEGVKLPRVAQDQYNATTKLPAGAQLQPGDLVFFGQNTRNISHVGIYIGNGQMVDAPHTGANVRTENYQWGDYVGATRPVDPTGQSMLPAAQPAAQPATPAAAPASVPTREMSLGSYYKALTQVMDALAQHGATVGGAK